MARLPMTNKGALSTPEQRDDAARAYFEQCKYTECIAALEGSSLAEDFVLQLRCLVRLGRYHEVVRANTVMRLADLDDVHRLRATIQVATACHRANMKDAADRYFSEAYELAGGDAHFDDVAELRYFDALRALSRHDLDYARNLVLPLRNNQKWAARAIAMHAWISAVGGDLHEQLRLLVEAIAAAQQGDVFVRAELLQSAAELSTELHKPDIAAMLLAEASSLGWTHDLLHRQINTLLNLASGACDSGNAFVSYEILVQLADLARNVPELQFRVHVDMAMVAYDHGDKRAAEKNFYLAYDKIDGVAWHNVGSARIGLIYMTMLAVKLEKSAIADEVWQRYGAIQTMITPVHSFGIGDQRKKAMELFAEGMLHRIRNQRNAATACLKEAMDIWVNIGYEKQAVLCAIELTHLTNSRKYYEYAVLRCDEIFPKAWFSRQLDIYRSRLRHPEIQGLSDTRQSVLLGIMQGKRDKEIAEELNLSHNTIRHRVSELLTLYGIHSRDRRELARVLKERGIH